VHDDPKDWGAWASLYHMLRAGGDHPRAQSVKRYLEQHNVDVDGWTAGGVSAVIPRGAGQVPAP
jgi:hypothetical protein